MWNKKNLVKLIIEKLIRVVIWWMGLYISLASYQTLSLSLSLSLHSSVTVRYFIYKKTLSFRPASVASIFFFLVIDDSEIDQHSFL